MSRHERRAAMAQARKAKVVRTDIRFDQICSRVDVWFESKGQLVMICANPAAQKAAEDLWPDIRWSRDEAFSLVTPDDWKFAHVRVTRLPPHLKGVPLTFASGDSLAFATAAALSRHAQNSVRVGWWTGDPPKRGDVSTDLEFHIFGNPPTKEEGVDHALYVEYVPSPITPHENTSVH